MNWKKSLVVLAGAVALTSCSLTKKIVHENGLEYIMQENNIEIPKYDKSKGITVKGVLIKSLEEGSKIRIGNIWEYTKFDRNNDGKYDLVLLEHYSNEKGKIGTIQVFQGEALDQVKKPKILTMRELHEDENFDSIRDWTYLNFEPSGDKKNLFLSKHNEKGNNKSFEEMREMFDKEIIPYKFKD
ncbi:MAG: hypothetical protein KKA65_01295 [Nanoarchaeota archaeon]|nr:hypothetical protein [Nanoarchaeota archaeon]MBU4242044.1 hypothetical protein [Nanoarchaeota archaeon]MBU4352709.1 hypothetical protein [Nanoarchaeota archaeon]MBU4456115.1 hypothetical protein [Nanoarchaeota archaeon]MCG2720147.1 hypothetical protein [Nanoarchaeota archaeon]